MTRRLAWAAIVWALAVAVARFGEPRPVALVAAGLAAVTVTFDVVRDLDDD